MAATVATVAYLGLEARAVEVQVQLTSGIPKFTIVGLADKAVAESRERVRAALASIGLALPPKVITVNLSPADLPKEGSHYDLPIALGLLAAMGATDAETLSHYVAVGRAQPRRTDRAVARRAAGGAPCFGARSRPDLPRCTGGRSELGGRARRHRRARPAGVARPSEGHVAGAAPPAGRGRGARRRARPRAGQRAGSRQARARDRGGGWAQSADERTAGRGQVAARRLSSGHSSALAAEPRRSRSRWSPRSRASLAAARSAAAGPFARRITARRCRRWSAAGSRSGRARSASRISACCSSTNCRNSSAPVLDSLRQPLETGNVSVARANTHVTFPARVQLVAAMNPCRCGHLGDPALACSRAPRCAADYQARVSGPLLDRIDLHVEVPGVSAADLTLPPPPRAAPRWRARVATARQVQAERYNGHGATHQCRGGRRNARRGRDAGRARPQALGGCSQRDAPVGARLPPRAPRRANHRRPGRRRGGRPDPHRRSPQLSPPGTAQLISDARSPS